MPGQPHKGVECGATCEGRGLGERVWPSCACSAFPELCRRLVCSSRLLVFSLNLHLPSIFLATSVPSLALLKGQQVAFPLWL